MVRTAGEELRRGHDHQELGDILGDEHELQRDRQPRLLLPVPGAGGHPGGELGAAGRHPHRSHRLRHPRRLPDETHPLGRQRGPAGVSNKYPVPKKIVSRKFYEIILSFAKIFLRLKMFLRFKKIFSKQFLVEHGGHDARLIEAVHYPQHASLLHHNVLHWSQPNPLGWGLLGLHRIYKRVCILSTSTNVYNRCD